MCEFCHEHGEGKKWYLQAKNYSQELWNDERRQFTGGFLEKIEENAVTGLVALDKLMVSDPAAAKAAMASGEQEQKRNHWGQVVPLEEIEQILDMNVSVVRFPCVCRSTLRGVYDARYCFGTAAFQSGSGLILQYPDWSTDLEVLTAEEAKKAIQKLDRNGLVHTVWTMITPYIGGICNCNVNDCMALKMGLRYGNRGFFKAEYIATIDWESCSGCRDCMKLCNFGAISYSPLVEKCYIDQFQCYGCGVCRALCNRDAISLRDRNAIPVLANEW